MKPLRCYLLATASSVALVGTATAADLPVKAPFARAPVLWSWAGPYIGLNAGVAWRNTSFSNPDAFGTITADPIWSDHATSFIGGGQIGYNWQSGNLVYGVEGDIDWVNGKSSAATPGGTQSSTKMDWMSTIRGRAGVTVSPRILAYLTGGVALARFSDIWGFPPTTDVFTSNNVRAGWTGGGGLEYMLDPHWTVRVEGLYADFGSKNAGIATFGSTYSSSFRHSVAIARGALNWKW
jgi:outer membrane immunogenic protein